jgi:plastocyanin
MSFRRHLIWALCALLPLASAYASTLKIKVVDSAGRPLEAAVVYLDSPEARALSRPARDAFIAQIGKQFQPRVTVVPVGTAVSFPNRDTVRHHVYSFSKIKTFELKLYAGTPALPVAFDQPGIAVLGCNIHDFMVAWVVVVETPYYGRTNAEGEVTLSNVPEGSYRLRSWHESLPEETPPPDQPLRVAGPSATASITLTGSKP